MNELNIGDRVRVKDYTDISDVNKAKVIKDRPYMWNTGKARLCGEEGVIVDKLYSEAHNRFIYFVHLDGYEKASHAQFDADSLELIVDDPVTYSYEFDYLDNKVVEKGIEDISFNFDWNGSCSSVEIHLTHWGKDKIEVVSQERYNCYYDHDWDGCNLEGLYKTLDEWEARYGLR